MSGLFLCLLWLAGAALLLAPLARLLKPSSLEAERMFVLVQSGRPDERSVPRSELLMMRCVHSLRVVRKFCKLDDDSQWSKRLLGAGLRGSFTEEVFFAVQLCGLLVGGFGAGWCLRGNIFASAGGAIFGFLIPGLWLTIRRRERRTKLRRSVPDMVDLLVICVGAGLGLDQALLRVGEELQLSHPEITEELERVFLERQAGTPRIEAWQALAERAQIEELFLFTSMLAETDRFGTPITKALGEFSEELRMKRRQRAEEAAAKTKVKIIFPLVLCIFPCIFVVLLLPALLHLIRNFNGLSH